ncbi:MAG: hypothetical protein UU47_C0014G0017 [candidate division TM6 bacterium GW2011_GWE2_41_16]|nr:MAG: hypothetical protein UU47_C0014G0017 [candidate division TM6 bacterium GW2011_GWE2_41_16]
MKKKLAFLSILVITQCALMHATDKTAPASEHTTDKKQSTEKELTKNNPVLSDKNFENELVDCILATVYLQDQTGIVLQSDLRPHLDGSVRTLDDAINEKLIELDAPSVGVQVSGEDVSKFIEVVEKEANLDKAGLREMFEQLGYSYDEGLDQVRLKQIIDRVLEQRVRGTGSMLTEKEEVIAYNKEHPEYTKTRYELSQTVAPADKWTEESLLAAAEKKELDSVLKWEEPFTINEQEIAPDRREALVNALAGEIVTIDRAGDYYELTKLVSKKPSRLLSLDERYDEIAMDIQHGRFDERLDTYRKDLRSKAIIRHENA